MTHEQFVFWLDGFLANRDSESFGPDDIRLIQAKLGMAIAIAPPWRDNITVAPSIPFDTFPNTVSGMPISSGAGFYACPSRVSIANDG